MFLVNVAPCVRAVVLALRLLPDDDEGRRGPQPLDVAGAVTATAGLALLVLGFTRAEQAGPAHPSAWGSRARLCCWRSRASSGVPPTRCSRPALCGGRGWPFRVACAVAAATAVAGALTSCALQRRG